MREVVGISVLLERPGLRAVEREPTTAGGFSSLATVRSSSAASIRSLSTSAGVPQSRRASHARSYGSLWCSARPLTLRYPGAKVFSALASPVPARCPLVLVALLCGVAVPACQGKDSGRPGGAAASSIGQPAPALAGKTIDGDPLALADLQGQVVLVNVWATWCKPCMRELPELATLHRNHSAQGFTVLGVSVDKRQMLGKVRSMVTSYALEYPMLFDPESQAIDPWQIAGYPTSVLIGRDGTIRWRRDGMIHPDDPELDQQIEAALAQPAS